VRGDYRVQHGSPAQALGFANFPMNQFGVQKPELKAIARVPQLPQPKTPAAIATVRAADPVTWLGASVRNIRDEGERSAFGLPGVTGVLVLDVPMDSALAKAGLRKNDVIFFVNVGKTPDTTALLQQAPELTAGNSLKLGVSRDQKKMILQLAQ
jgi:S1-C subfamily serine protease